MQRESALSTDIVVNSDVFFIQNQADAVHHPPPTHFEVEVGHSASGPQEEYRRLVPAVVCATLCVGGHQELLLLVPDHSHGPVHVVPVRPLSFELASGYCRGFGHVRSEPHHPVVPTYQFSRLDR